MFFSFYILFSYCFEPKCTSSFSGDLWGSVNNFNCDGDALLTISSQTITLDKWCDIGSWNKHVTGTLKIQGIGKVIVEGGFKITGWTSDSENPNILKTTVEQKIHASNSAQENHVTKWAFESLWVNDHSTTRARVPSGWTLPTIKSVSTSGSGDFITYTVGVPSNTMKFLQNLSKEELNNVNIVIFHYWSTTRAYITSIDTNANTITFTAHKVGDNNKGIEAGKAYFYLENLKTALTKPGEWFLSTNGELYYYPLQGETVSNIEAYASHDKRLMYIGASNIILENIEFRHCGGNIPDTGVTREDNLPSSSALNMKCVDVYQSTNVQFINCSFRHVFCRALSLFECTSCVVEQCLIEDFGADGISVGDSSKTRIYNNIIRHGGRLIHHENAFYDNLDPGAVISHNDISDNFWDGINCWLKDSECEMTIEKNHVHDIGFNLLDDIGCIYVTNAKKGVVVQNNYVHKAGCHNYGAWGLYIDLDCHDVVVQNNLAHDFYDGCIHFHYGFNNVAKNNILGFNKVGLISKGQNDEGTMVTISNNIFITNEGSFYCDMWASNSFNSFSNLYWDFNKGIKLFGNDDGKDNTGIFADPKFTDPLNRVFTFTDDSVAKNVGFVPFVYSDCGVVGETWRKVASNYNIPPFPEKSTDDESLFSNEKVYPDYDKVITASESATQSLSATQSPSESPSQSPSYTPTPVPSNTPTSTPSNKYSNREFKGSMETIYLTDYNLIENSKFIDCSLTDNGDYMIVIQKEATFNNVEFSFSNSNIGAIKIEYDGEITIENCRFIGCSVNNGNGNAILVSESKNNAESILNIDNCEFKNCGTGGYTFYLTNSKSVNQMSQLNLINSLFEFDTKNASSGLYINHNNREVNINSCIFNQCIPNGDNDHISTISIVSSNKIMIYNSNFNNCGFDENTIVISIKPNNVNCAIQNCTFDSFSNEYLTGSPISTYKTGISLIRNIFRKCNSNAIQIINQVNDNDSFQLIENKFIDCISGILINVFEGFIKQKPQLIGNSFENIYVDSELFVLKIDSPSLTFENNVFHNISTKYGGFGGRIILSQSNDIDLSFTNCTFIDNSQEFLPGGAFQSSVIQNNGNVNLKFDECFFQNNSAKEFGGALYISLVSTISINGCKFVNNFCGNQGGAIFIDYSKTESIKLLSSDAFCSITSCMFEGNKAKSDGNAIYVSDSRTDANYIIENNKFESNYYKSDSVGYVIVTKAIDIDISTNQFSNPNSQVKVNPYMNIQKPPFITPEPLIVENVYQNEKGEVDTSSFIKNNTEYLLQVTQEKVTLQGNGNENLYLQIPNDFGSIDIVETEATFGVKLDSNTTIKLNQEEAHMNIKGDGNLTIKADENITSISIGDVIISQKENLQVNTKPLSSFKLGNIKMYGKSSFDANVQENDKKTEVKSIKIFKGADSKMSNLKITEKVDIETGSSIILNNVDLSNSEISLELLGSNQSYSTISGDLGNSPSSIILKVQENEKAQILEEQIVCIASAPEKDFTQCEQWKKCVNLEGTKFKGVSCKTDNGNKILYVSTSEVIEPTPKKKSNLLPIVVGIACGVVVIIIIIIVVVVVLKKKKKKEPSSDIQLDTEKQISI